jgi:hypothetical protein
MTGQQLMGDAAVDTTAVAGTSPVMLVVQKRIRAAKKKLARISELEQLVASGKELSADQVRRQCWVHAILLLCHDPCRVLLTTRACFICFLVQDGA